MSRNPGARIRPGPRAGEPRCGEGTFPAVVDGPRELGYRLVSYFRSKEADVAIHQELELPGTPQRVFEALTDSKRFSALSGGAPAQISGDAGGSFTVFGGMVEGRNIELVPGRRVVQAWRSKAWPEGVYSVARFELSAAGAKTRLVFDHTGFPEDQAEPLAAGWESHYWTPLRKHLA
jgi:activator of HSP90 ATPase